MIQGSAEWFQIRAGSLTGSRIYEACAKTKERTTKKGKITPGRYYEARSDLLMEKLIERLTGQPAQHFVTDAMQWGTMYEGEARSVYETRKGVLVQDCAYFKHPSIAHSGASPDGIVGKEGVIEIKCPTTKVHLETVLTGEIPQEHIYQMAWEIESAGVQWCDFISYDPRLPGNLAFFCKRYYPAPDFLDALRVEVKQFLSELDALEAKVRAYTI